MKVIFRIIKTIFIIFCLLALAYILFFIILILPNDKRVKSPQLNLTPITEKRIITHNFITLSTTTQISHHDYEATYQQLKLYPYINDNRDYHLIKENMHISLGWYPLRVIHKNCLYAPTPSTISYQLTIPQNKPQLEFACGIIDKSADFIITVVDEKNKNHTVFQEKIQPLLKFPYKHEDEFNKNFYQYWNVQMEDRNSEWYEYKVDLTNFAGQKVTLQLQTKGDTAQAFWANPVITELAPEIIKKPNLILIIVDSLRKDAVGVKNLTPNLDKLAAQGVSFEKAIANGNMTKQSVSSFLTSRFPFELGDIALEYVASDKSRTDFYHAKIPTLASVLNDNGYLTCSIGTVSLITDGAGFGVDFGFNEARIIERYGYSNVYIVNETIDWLSKHGDLPFGLLIYVDAPHGPYKPPFRYFWKAKKTLTSLTSEKWYRTLYEAAVIYTDLYLGKLFEAIDKLDLTNDTLIIVLSDHGENLAVHTLPGTKKKVVFHDHGISLKEEDVHIPLVMRFPGRIPTNTKVQQTVQLIDLLPTILDLMNIKIHETFRGRSVKKLIYGEKLSPEDIIFMRGRFNKGVRVRDKYKYIRNFGVYEKRGRVMQTFIPEELYNLEKDPRETTNIIDREVTLRQEMRQILDRFEPDPEINILKFSNMRDKSLSGVIIAKGKVDSYSLEGKGQINASDDTLEFNVIGEKAAINFTTKPYNASLKVRIKYDGQEFPIEKVLIGSYGLPLLKEGQKEITPDDFYLMKGTVLYPIYPHTNWANKLDNKAIGVGVNWGRQAQYKLEWEKQKGVSGTFKEMLAEWGYLSEPTKK